MEITLAISRISSLDMRMLYHLRQEIPAWAIKKKIAVSMSDDSKFNLTSFFINLKLVIL